MALINLRNALMTGKRLPYDAEVEYLESTGTQWIDTGVNAKQSLKIRAVFESSATSSHFVYGVRAGDSTITCAAGFGTSLGYARWGTSAYAGVVPSGLVDITQDSSGVIVNGTSSSYSATQTVVEQSGYTMVVFAGRNSATTVTSNMVGKFYSCKIWDNGVLVRDYIPVRKGTVGYLYDRVTGKLFGNAGTGDFVLGPDVVPVEYLECTSSSSIFQYIDTGIVGTGDVTFTAPIYRSTDASNECAIGAFGYSLRYWASYFFAQKYYLGMGSRTHSSTDAPKETWMLQELKAENNKFNLYSNGSLVATCNTSTFDTTQNIYIGAMNNSGTASYPFRGRFGVVKFYQSGDLVRDYIPVRVGSGTSWEGAMMDVLTRRIYRNQGTGAFTYGNDLKYPIPAE